MSRISSPHKTTASPALNVGGYGEPLQSSLKASQNACSCANWVKAGVSFQADPDYRPPTWPETGEEQQKMIHLEVLVDDLPAAVEVALAAGGTLAAYQPREDLRVVLDPAGHPLCLFTE